MDTLTVRYKVPVVVEVDLENQEVIRVTEHPEGIELETPAGRPSDRMAKAIEIAEGGGWPAWERDY